MAEIEPVRLKELATSLESLVALARRTEIPEPIELGTYSNTKPYWGNALETDSRRIILTSEGLREKGCHTQWTDTSQEEPYAQEEVDRVVGRPSYERVVKEYGLTETVIKTALQ